MPWPLISWLSSWLIKEGQRGLTDKQLTLLHDHSIRDDPTRVIRAARYAARLGFTLDEKLRIKSPKLFRPGPGLGPLLLPQRRLLRRSRLDGTRPFVPQ